MAKLDDLKTKATEMGIEFKSKATIADLELLIALKEDEEANPPIEETPEDETPKLNKDGFEAGKILTPAEVAEYLAKQRAKK
jgi:hypothetical protein